MVNPTDLEEGDDVYFECIVSANPPAYKLTWWHNVSIFRSTHSVYSFDCSIHSAKEQIFHIKLHISGRGSTSQCWSRSDNNKRKFSSTKSYS